MKRLTEFLTCILGLAITTTASAAAPARDYPIRAVPFTDVHIADAFWSPRLETNRVVTVPYAFQKCEETGRIDNFAKAGKLKEGKFEGIYFNDSDVFKVIEGAAYALAYQRDPKLEAYVDGVIDKIAAAQEPDGYLYTARTLCGPDYMPPGGKERWSDIAGGHELYNVGHLYEGAIAYYQATGNRKLLEVALKNADLICQEFGPGRRPHPPGHQQIEIGLARLYRITGDAKYLQQAKWFLDARGRAEGGRRLYGEYSQDHKPVIEQEEAVGHAVRAAYMYTGMADVAALTGDAAYVKAIRRIWNDVVERKLYLTGGIGAAGGHEGFGAEYFLPNRTAYCETCASVANAMWNHRMFLWTGEGRFLDVVEQVIYNAFLSGISMAGDRFFYPNRLESFHGERRQPWFSCACCPANIVRFVPSIPGYAYAHRDDTVFVNLFIGGSAEVKLPNQTLKLTQETRYPWDGRVKVTLAPERAADLELAVRVPGWARNQPLPGDLYRFAEESREPFSLKVNGQTARREIKNGYARIRRAWKSGDVVELELPMPVRRVLADEKIQADLGRVAVQRGPIVYCAEGLDQPDNRVMYLLLPDDAALRAEERPDLLHGIVQVRGQARLVARAENGTPQAQPAQDLTLIPYYAQAHRELTPMSVWLARDVRQARALPAPTLARTSTVKVSRGTGVEALNDQLEARSSDDHSNPFFHWWPKKNPTEWVEYHFAKPARVSAVEVYWFDDHGGCRLPQSWKLLAKAGDAWKEVTNPSAYGVAADRFNPCSFDPVVTEGLRLEVQLPEHAATGIHEWVVKGDKVATPAATPTAPAAGTAAKNLVPNPSFEEAAGDRPRSWRPERWGGEATFSHASIGHSGGRSALIASDQGADVGWSANVAVEPSARYRLAGWIKTENVKAGSGRGALFNLHNLQTVATPAVTGTKDWTRVEVEFDIEDQDSVQVNCLLGGWGQATGKAWYDDVELSLIGRQEAPAPRITVDAAKVGERLSPNIYSQFIEHLGRCIYGGIWAEMLEDRKFYYPITADYNPYRSLRDTPFPVVGASPWQIVGPAASVTMSREQVFVGRHTPRIQAGAGIRQRDLGVTQGKACVGYVWLKAASPERAQVEIALHWGEAESARQVVKLEVGGGDYRKFPFEFTPAATTDRASLDLRVRAGAVLVGTLSLMPADHVEGMRADTLALLRELDAPIYRWPGGNFVSGYDWRDGIGDRDRRPPRTNPAWTGVEHNDFGMHEFIRFCRLVKAEPWITVNTGFGDAYSAAAQLEYCNGGADTHMGKLRAANGAPEPFGVKYWGIGNEMFGSWQLGYMRLEHYVLKQNWVVDKMREVDSNIVCIASGNSGPWSTGLLRGCSDHMDFIAEHFYCQERSGLASHVRQIPDNIRRKAEFHRQARRDLPQLKGKDIRIAMTEWNYWYGPHPFGELGTRYFLKDALGIAAGVHEYARQSDIVASAFYAQTVNVIGCIKTSRRNAAFETTGLVLKLYRHQFGELPVATETTGLLDAQAAWRRDRSALTLSVVNPTLSAVEVPLDLRGARLKGTGRRWQIAGSDPMAFNDPDEPPRVRIEEAELSRVRDTLKVEPCSVTLFALEVAP